MIPIFPEFKSIEWTDRKEVEQFTAQFPPYSDFNFVSMWSWNTREKMKLSKLHGNLVILFYDYVSETPFLTFIGNENPAYTAQTLIEYSKRKFQIGFLKLIPECVAAELPHDQFNVMIDKSSNDYIISVDYLSSIDRLPTNSNQAARFYKKYTKLYPNHIIKNHSVAEIAKEDFIELFKHWAKTKSLTHEELNEYNAFERYIQNKETENSIFSIYDNGKMIGFVGYEILPCKCAIAHFFKADTHYTGIYDKMFYAVANLLQEQNILYWNFEQDLGIEGLRRSKIKYKPAFYLKKYIVEQKKPFHR